MSGTMAVETFPLKQLHSSSPAEFSSPPRLAVDTYSFPFLTLLGDVTYMNLADKGGASSRGQFTVDFLMAPACLAPRSPKLATSRPGPGHRMLCWQPRLLGLVSLDRSHNHPPQRLTKPTGKQHEGPCCSRDPCPLPTSQSSVGFTKERSN